VDVRRSFRRKQDPAQHRLPPAYINFLQTFLFSLSSSSLTVKSLDCDPQIDPDLPLPLTLKSTILIPDFLIIITPSPLRTKALSS
jgi:hypothetical protein